MVVLPFSVGTDRSQRAAPFNGPVFADDVMITDASPAVSQMSPVDSGCRRIAIGDADMMDDDHVRLRPQEQRFPELEMCFLNSHRFGRCRIGDGIIIAHDAAGSGWFGRPRYTGHRRQSGGGTRRARCCGFRFPRLILFIFPSFLEALAAFALALAAASIC